MNGKQIQGDGFHLKKKRFLQVLTGNQVVPDKSLSDKSAGGDIGFDTGVGLPGQFPQLVKYAPKTFTSLIGLGKDKTAGVKDQMFLKERRMDSSPFTA